MIKLISIFVLCIVLTGCGAKGALYLSKSKPQDNKNEKHLKNVNLTNESVEAISKTKTSKDKPES